jgi:tetratricopeptide (TPR) repeat protein
MSRILVWAFAAVASAAVAAWGQVDPLFEPIDGGAVADSMVVAPELVGPVETMEAGDYAGAAEELLMLVGGDSLNTQALRLLASAYLHLDARTEAIDVCRRLSELDSTSAAPEIALGYLHEQSGDSDLGEFHYRRALERDQAAVQAYQGLGWIHLKRRELEQAMAMATATSERAPEYGPNYILVGRVLTAQGFFKDAAESYRRAFRLEPTLRERYGILLQELVIRHDLPD